MILQVSLDCWLGKSPLSLHLRVMLEISSRRKRKDSVMCLLKAISISTAATCWKSTMKTLSTFMIGLETLSGKLAPVIRVCVIVTRADSTRFSLLTKCGIIINLKHVELITFGMIYRWKGENVATTEVSDILMMVDCIEEANVYGVKVKGRTYRDRIWGI